jgi:hypothetical protein
MASFDNGIRLKLKYFEEAPINHYSLVGDFLVERWVFGGRQFKADRKAVIQNTNGGGVGGFATCKFLPFTKKSISQIPQFSFPQA